MARESSDPESRYGLAESVTFAFLIALEVLSARQRAVLLLRDVLGQSAQETAEFVGTSEGGVRVAHLRARRALAAYDTNRCNPTGELRKQHRAVLERFLDCLTRQDVQGIEAMLAESIRTVTDAAGKYTALATPFEGRARVARFYRMASLHRQEGGTTLRQHPGESVIRFAFLLVFAGAMGASPVAFGIYRLASLLIGLSEHANIRLPLGLDTRIAWAVTSPNMHKVHHSRRQAETDTNATQTTGELLALPFRGPRSESRVTA